ncbi:histidine kinase [Erythrobacter sp. Dej080120_24]|uniref:sensor histidine kinase n=1 Tax=Erythrobacter sp. Dej080120_24 TaxID=3024837 RepID=UPI00292056CB|nr:histidine kinase [Erythrobacter sp. Dej080120_24]
MSTCGIPLERHARSEPLNFSEPRPWPTGTPPAEDFCKEDERLVILSGFHADDLFGDEELARITRFAARLCNAPSAAVSLVEAHRQRFVTGEGIGVSETPRSTSFCAHTMLGHDLLEVLDATQDPRFAEFAMVRGDAHLRYYAGAPLISAEGAPLGALCVTDTVPRSEPLSDFQREGLAVLAEAVMRRLHAHRQANMADSELKESADRLQFMLDSVPDIAWSAAPGPHFDYFNARFSEVTGRAPLQDVEDWRTIIHPDDFEATAIKFQHALDTATFFEDEWRLRLADGSFRWVISRAVPSTADPATARWFGTLTDIHDRYSISQERELLAGELAHRIKNIFSVITGLISLNARGDKALSEFAASITDNIRALSRAQDFALNIDPEPEDNLKELLGVLMSPYGVGDSSAVIITGDNVITGARATTPLALVFHELATNSAKYGALSVAEGAVSITIEQADADVRIEWRETGGPPTQPPQDKGFGSRLVTMAIEHQLGGKIAQDWQPDGLIAHISIPAARLRQ